MQDLFDILLSDLRDSVVQFNRLLWAGLLFALGCHFYVVEPYFRYKADRQRASGQIVEKTSARDELTNELSRIEGPIHTVQETLASVRAKVRGYPDHLRARLPEIRDAVQRGSSLDVGQQQGPARVGNFPMPVAVTNFEVGVRWYVEVWFQSLTSDLEQGVAVPLSKIDPNAGPSRWKGSADKAIQNLRVHLDKVDPDFWRRYGEGKVEVARQLQQVVEEFFGPIENEASGLLERTRDRLRKQQSELDGLQEDLRLAEERKRELESRVESLEAPLGRLPLGLPDLITLFPLLVAGLIVMLTTALQRANRLRVALQRDPAAHAQPADKAAFDLCTECWFLPPYRSAAKPLLLATTLLTLAAVAVRGGWLLMARSSSLGHETDTGVLTVKSFPWMHAGSALLILFCLASVCRILLRRKSEAVPKAAEQ